MSQIDPITVFATKGQSGQHRTGETSSKDTFASLFERSIDKINHGDKKAPPVRGAKIAPKREKESGMGKITIDQMKHVHAVMHAANQKMESAPPADFPGMQDLSDAVKAEWPLLEEMTPEQIDALAREVEAQLEASGGTELPFAEIVDILKTIQKALKLLEAKGKEAGEDVIENVSGLKSEEGKKIEMPEADLKVLETRMEKLIAGLKAAAESGSEDAKNLFSEGGSLERVLDELGLDALKYSSFGNTDDLFAKLNIDSVSAKSGSGDEMALLLQKLKLQDTAFELFGNKADGDKQSNAEFLAQVLAEDASGWPNADRMESMKLAGLGDKKESLGDILAMMVEAKGSKELETAKQMLADKVASFVENIENAEISMQAGTEQVVEVEKVTAEMLVDLLSGDEGLAEKLQALFAEGDMSEEKVAAALADLPEGELKEKLAALIKNIDAAEKMAAKPETGESKVPVSSNKVLAAEQPNMPEKAVLKNSLEAFETLLARKGLVAESGKNVAAELVRALETADPAKAEFDLSGKVQPVANNALQSVQGAAKAELANQVLQGVDQMRVIENIARMTKMYYVDRRINQMQINLNPPDLGRLHLNLQFKGGVMTAEFQTENATTKDLLNANLPQLKAALANQGVVVESFNVSLRQQPGQQYQQQFAGLAWEQGAQGNKSDEGRDSERGEFESADKLEEVTAQAQKTPSGRLDLVA